MTEHEFEWLEWLSITVETAFREAGRGVSSDAIRDELARWKRPRDAKEHFVASEAVGPAMSDRL